MVVISIHALREEGDWIVQIVFNFTKKFLSTPSARRATSPAFLGRTSVNISIHALREEGDAASMPFGTRVRYFYPRPPRGGRLHALARLDLAGSISIHALREEGDYLFKVCVVFSDFISIHALREEGDLVGREVVLDGLLFLSTPSARRATRVW